MIEKSRLGRKETKLVLYGNKLKTEIRKMQDHYRFKPPEPHRKCAMPPEILILVLTGSFLMCFWIWFFLIRAPLTESDKEYVQVKAMSEILAVCNIALSDNDEIGYFRREDIKEIITPPVSGVSAYVSIFEVSRNNTHCHWDGINPARVTRPEVQRPKDLVP